jgi:hypothetical protein
MGRLRMEGNGDVRCGGADSEETKAEELDGVAAWCNRSSGRKASWLGCGRLRRRWRAEAGEEEPREEREMRQEGENE